jgi:hypothetical protein
MFLQKLSEYFGDGKNTEISEDMMRNFYTELFKKDRDFFVASDFHSTINAFGEEYLCEKVKALAEIFYVEYVKATEESKKLFAQKSLEMFHFYKKNSSVFDSSVFDKITNLTQFIENE